MYRLRRAEETPQEREVRLSRRRERERVTLSAENRQSLLDQRRERNQRSRNSNAGLAAGNPTEVTLHAVDDHNVI